MEKNSKEFKELVFELMNGSLVLEACSEPEKEIVKNEYEDSNSKCSLLYEKVFAANRRLCERLHVEEDDDVEIIISSLLEIAEYQCMKMYDYGMMFAK